MALDCFNPSGLDDMRVQTGHIQGNVPAGVYGARPRARFAGTFCLKGDTRDCGAEPLPAAETGEAEQGQTQRPRPADETGSCVWRSAPVFASTLRGAPQKSAKRKRQTQRPRPADETGSCVWRSAPVFASTLRGAPQKSAKRKRNAVCLLQGRHDARRKSREPQPRISVPRLRAEMGPPLENF